MTSLQVPPGTPVCSSVLRWRGRTALTVAAGILLIVFVLFSSGLRCNLTASLPRGLWLAEPIDRPLKAGDIVTFCPPDTDIFRAARDRGYIGSGLCPGGLQEMMKPVLALPGDVVSVETDGIAVNGRRVPATKAVRADEAGRSMGMPERVGEVAPGEVWLVSVWNPKSFDSRYFGAIPMGQVRAFVHPLWTEAAP